MERSGSATPVLAGSMTALVTPFRDGAVDWETLDVLVDRQIKGGTDWIVALGTTAETPTLTGKEREAILQRILDRVDDRCPVMAGTGSNCTREAISRTRFAASLGADAVLVATPYYNKPTQDGMFRHFVELAQSTDVPIVLYNVPARTGVELEIETIARLRRACKNIVAVKDATGGIAHLTELQRRSDITVLCGDDLLTWPAMAVGARGVVSVLGNLVPQMVRSLVVAVQEGRMKAAQALHRKLDDLAGELGRLGPNPVPIKTALALVGLIQEEFRLPLCPLDSDPRSDVQRILQRHEISATNATPWE